MLIIRWLFLMLCSMVAVVVFVGLCAIKAESRRLDGAETGQDIRGLLLRLGAGADGMSGVVAGSILGLHWMPGFLAGALFYLMKLAVSRALARRVSGRTDPDRTAEEQWAERQEMWRRSRDRSDATSGWLAWTAFAIVNLVLLFLLLLPLVLWFARLY